MDILDEIQSGDDEQVDLYSLVSAEKPVSVTPLAARRNRAASTALLSDDPERAVSNYQLMLQESEGGQDAVLSSIQSNIQNQSDNLDMRAVIGILSDPTIPLERKQEVIGSVRNNKMLRDTSNTLHTRALEQASQGENADNEAARISSVSAIREIYQSRNDIQGLVNAHAKGLDSADVETFFDLIGLYVVPFGNSLSTAKISGAAAEARGGNYWWNFLKGFALPGTAVANQRELLSSIPPEKRAEFAKGLIGVIQNNSGLIFGNDNQFAQYDKVPSIFEDGGYGSAQEFIDNVSPLLDIIGIGQFVRGGTRGIKAADELAGAGRGAESAESVIKADWELVDDRPRVPENRRLADPTPRISMDTLDRIEYNNTIRTENPSSPAKVLQQSNPEKARAAHETVAKSTTDEVAEGLYGTDRTDAIVSDVYPQVLTESGAITSKVPDISRNLRQELQVDSAVTDYLANSGGVFYTNSEKAAVRANVVRDFSSAEGISINEAMSSFTTDGARIKISAVYGQENGSWVSAREAHAQAMYALRQQGVLPDEIEILQKQGLDHVPVKLEDVAETEGDYLVRINTFHEIDPTDVANFDRMTTKRNLFDSIPTLVSNNQGTFTKYLFDAASVVDPVISRAASVASDAESRFDKILLNIANDYAEKFKAIGDKTRQAKINEYIKEANYNGIAFDQADLLARGFTPEEIDALKSWRKFWDNHFFLENLDMVRTLNAEGYQIFKHPNAELFARPIAKNSSITRLYDPNIDMVVQYNKMDWDNLYNNGGTIARLRRPTDFGGETVEHMIVRNTPTEYLRKVRDTDSVLNYRDGYFQIQYTAAKFVDEIEQVGGKTTRKAIAVAGDTPEAERFAQRMRSQGNGKEYVVRDDDRALQRGSDDWWDVESASGRIAQRHRGKLLEDGSGMNHLGDSSYVINPVDSAIRAARSIAGRTVSRPMLEAAKARTIQQYGRLFPTNDIGQVRWPKNVSEIGAKGEFTSKDVRDARTVYEHINYLENGYINSIDNAWKAAMNLLGNSLGRIGLGRAERGAKAVGEIGPASLGKNTVFTAYIGTNIFRQLIVQPHQMVRTFAYNAQGWLSGRIQRRAAAWAGQEMGIGGPLTKDNKEFADFLNNSGLMAAVDKNNLVRGPLAAASDSTNRFWKSITTPFNITRRVGFDIGEQANLLGHAGAVFDRYKQLGKNMTDKAVLDEAVSEVRALSYDMNFAGDMVYNQTWPSVILQFMQVPHKALLQMTNRRLDRATRAKLLAGDLLLWGGPTVAVAELLGADILPDNPKLRETLTYGLESMLMNNLFTSMLGEDTEIDFSSLAPYEMTGWANLFHAIYSEGLEQTVWNSPAGQLFLKDGSRVQNAAAAMGRYFGVIDDYQDEPQTATAMFSEVMKISSGWNNVVKANLALEMKKTMDQYGNITDPNVNSYEAIGIALGFGTISQRELYTLSRKWSDANKTNKEDVLQVYNDIKRYYATKLETDSSDPRYVTAVTGQIMKVFENNPQAKQIVVQQLKQDLKGKDQYLLYQFLKRSGIPDAGQLKEEVMRAPVSEEQKQMMLQRIDDVQRLRPEKVE